MSLPNGKLKLKECRWCKNLNPEQDGPSPEARYFWYECNTTNYDNLLGFPFKKTKCKYFTKSVKYMKPTINEMLKELK